MDIKQLREIMEREGAKMIVVENGEPVMIISPVNFSGQKSFELDKTEKKADNDIKETKEINQNMDLITKEELPVDELRVEDLPF